MLIRLLKYYENTVKNNNAETTIYNIFKKCFFLPPLRMEKFSPIPQFIEGKKMEIEP